MQKGIQSSGLFLSFFAVLCTAFLPHCASLESAALAAGKHEDIPEAGSLEALMSPIPDSLLAKGYYFQTLFQAGPLSKTHYQTQLARASFLVPFTETSAEIIQEEAFPPCRLVKGRKSIDDKQLNAFIYEYGCLFDPDTHDRLSASFLSRRAGKPYHYSEKDKRIQWAENRPVAFQEYLHRMIAERYTQRTGLWVPEPKDHLMRLRQWRHFLDASLFLEQNENELWHIYQYASSHPSSPQEGPTQPLPSQGAPTQGASTAGSSSGAKTDGRVSVPHAVMGEAERGRYELDLPANAPAYPSELKGPEQQVAGALSTYTMALDMDLGDVSPRLRALLDDAYYHFALYNITELVKKGLLEQIQKEALSGKEMTGGKDLTLWAAKRRDLDRRLDDLRQDTHTAAKDLLGTKKTPPLERAQDAAVNTANLALTPASAIVSLGGFVATTFIDFVGGSDCEREVPIPKEPGYYLLRAVATPRPLGGLRHASSVAVKIIEVRSADYWAQEARDAEERALLDLTLQEKLITNPKRLAEFQHEKQALQETAKLSLEALLLDQKTTLQQQITQSPEQAVARTVFIGQLDQRIRLVQKYTPRFQDPARFIRVRAGFASEENSAAFPLLLQLGRLPDQSGRPRYGLIDATVSDGDFYEATGATEEEAIWNVFDRFAGHSGYGRGALAITLPPSDRLPALLAYSRLFPCHPTGTSLLRNRITDLTMVITLLSLPVTSLGSLALLLGGGLSAVRLYDRFERHTLRWDLETVTDALMVLGAAGSGVGALGKFVRLQVGNSFALAAKGVNVTKLTAALGQVETGAKTLAFAASAGGLITGNVLVFTQLKGIEERELSGAITHTEARRQSSEVLFHGLLSNILFIHGLRTPTTLLPEAGLTKAQGLEPLPIDGRSTYRLPPGGDPLAKTPAPLDPPNPTLPGKPFEGAPLRRALKPRTVGVAPATPAPEAAEQEQQEEEAQAATGTDSQQGLQSKTGPGQKPQGGASLTMMSGGQGSAGGNDTVVPKPAKGTVTPSGAQELTPGSQGPAPGPEGTSPDLVAKLAPDLLQVRAGLSLEARQRFDVKMRRIAGRSPWNNTHEATFQIYIESLARKGSVEAGLKGDESLGPERQALLPPPPKPPYGSPAKDLAPLRQVEAEMRKDIEVKRPTFNPKGLDALIDRITRAFSKDFIKMERGEVETTWEQTEGTRSNLKGIQAEWERAQAGDKAGNHVTEVSRTINVMINGEVFEIDVDVIEKLGRRWVEIKAGEPPRPGTTAEAEFLKQLRRMCTVAQDARFHVGGQPPEVVISFGKGEVSPSLKATLQQMSVQIEIRSQGVLP